MREGRRNINIPKNFGPRYDTTMIWVYRYVYIYQYELMTGTKPFRPSRLERILELVVVTTSSLRQTDPCSFGEGVDSNNGAFRAGGGE